MPTGELPRTVMLVADRHCCNTVTPGTRVTVCGIYSTYKVGLVWGHAGCRQTGAGEGAARTQWARMYDGPTAVAVLTPLQTVPNAHPKHPRPSLQHLEAYRHPPVR